CRSALAEAEVEYYDKTSPSIDVAFRAVDQDAVKAKFGLPGVSAPSPPSAAKAADRTISLLIGECPTRSSIFSARSGCPTWKVP
ncbi:hypothetical protein ONO39_27860, partial [Salmonella enterica subsp. enterica serovar Anatum]|nr:hypothetical protein [Salmonella enterica subsp. enterica serovar Anatum]